MPGSSITAKPGRNFLLKVADPDVSPSVFTSVAGIKNLQVSINNNPADITNHDSRGYREMLPDAGIQGYDISFDGIMAIGNAAFDIVNSKGAIQRRLLEFQLSSDHGDDYFFAGVVSQLQRSGPLSDAETFSATVMSHGTINYIP